MANLTFADTHNMVAFLSKSDASAGFYQIVDFFNAQVIQYALMVNPTIYVSCIKEFWTTVLIKKVNDVVKLRALIDGKRVNVSEDVIRHDLYLDDADGMKCLPSEEICTELTRRKFNFSTYIFDSMYISPTLTQKVFANMRRAGKGFSRVETPLLATMLVQPQAAAEEAKDEEVKVPSAPTPLSPTIEPRPPPQEPTTTSPQAQLVPSSPPQAQPQPDTSKSSMSILTTLMETCTTFSQKVTQLEQDKVLRRMHPNRGRIEAIDVGEEITLVDMEIQVDLGAEVQGRKDDDKAVIKEASTTEPTVFDDEEVTMTMAQKLIKMKAEKARFLDDQIAKREYNKVQTLFKPDKDVEEPQRKRVAKETLLQESFKKLKADKVSVSVSHIVGLDLSKLAIILNWLKKIYSKGLTVSTVNIIEGLHKGYDRFQTLLSQLEIRGAGVSHKYAKQKFLRSLPSFWSQVALIMRTKPGLDTLSFDDLYNNLRVFVHDVKGTTTSSSNIQNVAFVFADNTSSTNDINDADMEEMDLKWQVAMISMRIKKFYKRIGRKLAKGNQDGGKRDAGYNGNKARDNEALKEKEDLKTKFENWQNSSKNLIRLRNTQMSANDKFGLGYGDCGYGSILSYKNELFMFINKASDLEDTPVNDRYADGIHAVPPPMIRNCMPSGPDVEIDYFKITYGPKQTLADESDSKAGENAFCESNSSVETPTSMPKLVDNASKVVCELKVWADAPIIEEYMSHSDNDLVSNDDPHRALKDKGIIDSGCSMHMIGNKAYLADYQEVKGGYVAFRGSNGRITGNGKIKAGRLDFEDVYYVEELKYYNLFSVSQMCDKKNKVLFTDTDCLVLSPEFKNHVLASQCHSCICNRLDGVIELGDLKGTRIEHVFKRAFMSLFGQDADTFTNKYFVAYTRIEVKHFRDTLLQRMGNVKKSVFERARHQRQYDRRVNKRLMQTQESKIDMGKAVNDDLVVTESSGTESEAQDDNSR
nr:ribonuclease H-like domain-containing protein [Tanacetum cinerariifolium]GEW13229.1 ribonuclease H-like domain-containing protein [Tanacetum cinerariifolium]